MKKILIIIFFSLKIVAFGQDSLARYEQIALANNPDLKVLLTEHRAALLKAPVVAALPDPTAELGIFLEPMHLIGGNLISEMKLMQMIPWFGSLKAAKDEASQMALAKLYLADDFKLNLLKSVRISYAEMLRTSKEIKLLNENLELLQSIEKVSLSKYASNSGAAGTSSMKQSSSASSSTETQGGMGSMGGSKSSGTSNQSSGMANAGASGMNATAGTTSLNNILQIRLEIVALENQIQSLTEQLNTQKLGFNLLLNRDIFIEIMLPESEIPVPELSYKTFETNLPNHPMLKMQESDLAAALAEKQMAKRMGMPMIGLGVNYSLIGKREGNPDMMNGKDMLMPMVAFTLPIYRKKYKAQVLIADEKAMLASERKTAAANMLKVSFFNVEKQKNDAMRNKKLTELQLQLTEQMLSLQMAQFAAGQGSLEDILRTRERMLNYKTEQLNAETEHLKALFEMKYLTNE